MTCGYTWQAPYLQAPVYPSRYPKATSVKQVCCLQKGHVGPHRSLTNVTTERIEDRRYGSHLEADANDWIHPDDLQKG